jgi:hypothetical protein
MGLFFKAEMFSSNSLPNSPQNCHPEEPVTFDRFVFSARLPDDFSTPSKPVILRACDFIEGDGLQAVHHH